MANKKTLTLTMHEEAPSTDPRFTNGFGYFLSDVFQNYLITKNHTDTKINWLLGISGLIMTVSIPFIISHETAINQFALLVLAFSAFICFFICLLSLELPNFLLKKGHAEGSVMFYGHGEDISPEKISQDLRNIKNYDDVMRNYATTLHNLIERNIRIKNKLFKLANHLLLTGIAIGFVIIVISVFTGVY